MKFLIFTPKLFVVSCKIFVFVMLASFYSSYGARLIGVMGIPEWCKWQINGCNATAVRRDNPGEKCFIQLIDVIFMIKQMHRSVWTSVSSLRKLAHAIYRDFFSEEKKNENFMEKKKNKNKNKKR